MVLSKQRSFFQASRESEVQVKYFLEQIWTMIYGQAVNHSVCNQSRTASRLSFLHLCLSRKGDFALQIKT